MGALVLDPVSIDDFELNTESTCNDDIDNDCDGLIDCEDPDCALAPNCIGTCTDPANTPVGTCAATRPWHCAAAGLPLVQNCGLCGCAGPWLCGPAGTFCVAPCDGTCNGVCSDPACGAGEDPDCPAGNPCCGNNVCDLGETNATCPADCPVNFCEFTITFPCVFP